MPGGPRSSGCARRSSSWPSAAGAAAHGAGEAAGRHTSAWLIAAEVAWELIGGLAIGLVTGLAGGYLLRRAALPSSGLYPVAVLGLIVAVYGAASVAAASG